MTVVMSVAAQNSRTPWYELEVESTELGSPRVYTDGLVQIQSLSQQRELGGRFFCVDTKSSWEIVQNPVGTLVAQLVYEPGPGFSFGLPPPRLRLFPSADFVTGKTRSGNDASAIGRVVVSLEDVPKELLTIEEFGFQLELLRWMPKRSRHVFNNGSYTNSPMPQGFFHPSNWINGENPTPPVAGTRYGYQTFPANATVNRRSEWQLYGAQEMQRVEFTLADVFLPWYELWKIQDVYGNSATSLVYWLGKKRQKPSGVWSYGANPFMAPWKFRYSAYDQVSQRRVVGPYSETLFTRPRKWPTIPVAGSYPKTRQIQPDRQEDFRVLVASVGGRVTGRMGP